MSEEDNKDILDKLNDNEDQGSSSLPAEKIMNKLEEIEKKVDHIEEMELQQLKEEKKIEADEEKELAELKQATRKKEFDSLDEWQRYIWEGCKYKKEVKDSDEIEFVCEKQKGPCKFDDCPENWK